MVISVAILKGAKNGVRKTHLLNMSCMSYEQFIRYIDFLKVHGFIKECDSTYQTTDKGKELIKEFDSSSLIREVLTV